MTLRLTIFLLAALLLSAGIFPTPNQQPDQPNALWIVSEDNSPLIGCYGDPFATMPNIDRMAATGILYTNAFSPAPVCAPWHSTLVTGVYPPGTGTENMRSVYPVPDFVKFFPRYLRDAGYYTTNNARKDYNIPDQPDAWNESGGSAIYRNRNDKQPFFAVFNLGVSHGSSLHESIPTEKLRHNPASVTLPPYHPDTPEMWHDWAQYYDEIEDMDTQVGKLLADLDASDEADNTLVFYYSDHGGVLGRSKQFMYESGLHVPMVIRFPKKYAHLAPQTQEGRYENRPTRHLSRLCPHPPESEGRSGTGLYAGARLSGYTANARACLYLRVLGTYARAHRPLPDRAQQAVPLHPQLYASQNLWAVHHDPHTGAERTGQAWFGSRTGVFDGKKIARGKMKGADYDVWAAGRLLAKAGE